MELEVGPAATQYNDMYGTAAVDWQGGAELHSLARELGIDTDKYFPIRISFVGGGTKFGTGWPLTLYYVYAVEKAVAGQNAEEIINYANSHDGKLPVKRFDVEDAAEGADIGKYMKRFSVEVTTQFGLGKSFTLIQDDE